MKKALIYNFEVALGDPLEQLLSVRQTHVSVTRHERTRGTSAGYLVELTLKSCRLQVEIITKL
jgi:hypothetical protein